MAIKHPFGVPERAVWKSGPEGGFYVLIERDEELSGLYHVRIWHGRTGAVLAAGLFAVRAPGDPRLPVESTSLPKAWDGKELLLSDERVLVPVHPPEEQGRPEEQDRPEGQGARPDLGVEQAEQGDGEGPVGPIE